mgnify:CR=1 FL=1
MARQHILVAIDLAVSEQKVLKRALDLARSQGALLTILHVVEECSNIPEELQDDVRSAHALMLESARSKFDQAIIDCEPGHLEWHSYVESGSPFSKILALAEEIKADLIILGANRRRSWRDKILGSTADRVVRSASVPVLIVKRTFAAQYRRTVAALDLSPASRFVAGVACSYFWNGLQLVHVVQVPLTFEQAMLRSGEWHKLTSYREYLVKRAKEKLREFALQCAGSRKPPAIRVIKGAPVEVLLRLSRVRNLDLIVIGPHGHGLVVRALLGSVTLRLLREAACDVLVVPAPAGMERYRDSALLG